MQKAEIWLVQVIVTQEIPAAGYNDLYCYLLKVWLCWRAFIVFCTSYSFRVSDIQRCSMHSALSAHSGISVTLDIQALQTSVTVNLFTVTGVTCHW